LVVWHDLFVEMSGRDRYDGGRYDPRGGGRYGNLQTYDYANWGYIILYLVSSFNW